MSRKKRVEVPPKIERRAVFQKEFREDLRYWVETDRKIALRALDLVAGAWSRRLTQKHQLVYVVSDDRIDFIL